MVKTLCAATLLVTAAVFGAPAASASPVECKWDGVPVIINIAGSVNFICGDGNTVTHTTDINIPILPIDPHYGN